MLKPGPSFLLFWVFENLVLPAERRGFSKNKANKRNDPKVVLKTGPMLLRNILGPVLNTTLDLFSNTTFFVFLCFFGGVETNFYSVSAKNANFKKYKK